MYIQKLSRTFLIALMLSIILAGCTWSVTPGSILPAVEYQSRPTSQAVTRPVTFAAVDTMTPLPTQASYVSQVPILTPSPTCTTMPSPTPTPMPTDTPMTKRASRIWYAPVEGSGYWTMDSEGQDRLPVPNTQCCNLFGLSPDKAQCIYIRGDGSGKWNAGVIKFNESCEPIILLHDLETPTLMYSWAFDGRYVGMLPDYPWGTPQPLYVAEIESRKVLTIGFDVYSFFWVPQEYRLSVMARKLLGDKGGWYIVDPDGSDLRTVSEDILATSIEYSPDGQQIAVVLADNERIPRLFVCGANGRQCVEMNKDWGEYEYDSARTPKWSPDGSKIAFLAEYYARTATGESQWLEGVFVVDVITREQKLLYEDSICCQPLWSPDGKEVALQGKSSRSQDVYKISIETGERTILDDGNSMQIGQLLAWVWANGE